MTLVDYPVRLCHEFDLYEGIQFLNDLEDAKKLWEVSEKSTGVKFNL